MNKFLKVFIAILGAFNVVFSIFIPIAVVTLLITAFALSTFNETILLIVGSLATLYRGLKYLIIE